jgi:hypothetical protein
MTRESEPAYLVVVVHVTVLPGIAVLKRLTWSSSGPFRRVPFLVIEGVKFQGEVSRLRDIFYSPDC